MPGTVNFVKKPMAIEDIGPMCNISLILDHSTLGQVDKKDKNKQTTKT